MRVNQLFACLPEQGGLRMVSDDRPYGVVGGRALPRPVPSVSAVLVALGHRHCVQHLAKPHTHIIILNKLIFN